MRACGARPACTQDMSRAGYSQRKTRRTHRSLTRRTTWWLRWVLGGSTMSSTSRHHRRCHLRARRLRRHTSADLQAHAPPFPRLPAEGGGAGQQASHNTSPFPRPKSLPYEVSTGAHLQLTRKGLRSAERRGGSHLFRGHVRQGTQLAQSTVRGTTTRALRETLS